ncbi:MAG: DUF3159 domain-containing protein [Alloscardovia omnicolens]|uniref:DUF3159 domain-containing protein n=1 Tax=Alloscardovia omnicolens TaxID=419015 RepID=UPI00242B7EF0|nr:DUF3159 domain-containing protein [Alloscardovia omnicolens]MBS6346028.1 DUF3159 domain-containing protein [Alloscardovia omnicolens]
MSTSENGKDKGLKSLADSSDDFSVWEAIGGWRGVAEAVVPFVAFTVSYIFTQNLIFSLICVGVLLTAIIVARLVQKQTLMGALSGTFVTFISVAFAALQNSARDFYSPGIFINTFAVLILMASLILRKPGIGWILDQFTSESTMQSLYKPYVRATWVWIGGFVLRLAVEVPLYIMHNVEALGAARIITGVPLFACMLLISWLIIAPARKKDKND